RKQLAHPQDFDLAFQIRQYHRHVATELPDQLPASSARRSRPISVGHDGDGIESLLALADGFEKGHAFGTNGQTVGCVVHVAASTLTSPKGLPEAARSAAPTLKFEKLACAFSRASFAAAINAS